MEAFQGEIAKQILKFPKHYSNTVAVTDLDWPSGRVELLVRKLSCLERVTDTLVDGVVRAFSDELPSEGMYWRKRRVTDWILGEQCDDKTIGVV